jgi:hypothetical protein
MLKLWSYISNLGAIENESKDQLRRIHLINRMCFLATFTTFFFVFHMILMMGNVFYPVIQAATSFVCAFYILFSRKRLYRLSLYWVFFTVLLNVFYCSLELKGSGVEYFLIPLGLLPFVMEEGTKVCSFMVAISFAAFCASYFLREQYIPHEFIGETELRITYMVVMFSVFLICFFIILQFKTVYAAYERIIEQQRDEVENKNKEITDSIHYARRIQKSLLPTEKYIERHLKRMKKE